MTTIEEFNKIPENWHELFYQDSDERTINGKKVQPEADVFELGLALGGTVSAGAYTAGVLDFLIEALDAFEKYDGPDKPTWKVKIKVMTGTSGGGVNAALMARALSYQFPPIRASSSLAEQQQNPFYSIWVKDLDIMGMLAVDDLTAGSKPVSFLNSKPLEDCAIKIADYEAHYPANKQPRAYIDNPLPIFLTLTNLRGIPYKIDMGNGLSQEYVDHADYVRLSVFTQGANASYTLRPDEFGVSHDLVDLTSGYILWARAVKFALGTGAFPFGFPEQALSRPLAHYRYRPIFISDTANPKKLTATFGQVKWEAFITPHTTDNTLIEEYHFPAADGGLMDNEPIELCRRTLAGYAANNPRDGSLAKRAVLLIDPFADKATLGGETVYSLFASIMPVINSWKDQARYDSRDLLLAEDKNVFSRFMITAKDTNRNRIGGAAIACACADAFGGFLSESFRHHDYLLGRKNCQDFLRNEFYVYDNNPLVKDWAKKYPTHFSDNNVPLIPLYGLCKTDEQVTGYPSGQFDFTDDFKTALQNRLGKLVNAIEDNLHINGLLGMVIKPIVGMKEKDLTETVINWLDQSLKEWGLR